jgi:SAM-dependent methyltransferase
VAPVSVLSRAPVRLFLTATSLLFVELLLIRWIPANVIYVGYFRNFLLMASFLGIGVGILWGRDPKRVPLSPFGPLLLGLVVLVTQFRVSIELTSPDEIFFGLSESKGADINFLVLPGLVVIATMIMAGLAVPLGGLLRAMPPLKAYSIDIAGSMTGIALFTLLSATGTPPIVWFSVVAVLISLLGLGVGLSRGSLVTAGSLAAVLAIVGLGMPAGQVWSPYYRIDQYDSHGIQAINVNGIPHQAMWPLPPTDPFYEQVYRWFPERTYDNVLIVGAGSGTDVAVALKRGAKHVDAVEIDSRIQEIGVRDHPNRPYDDPRVTRINDDGRAFLRRTTNKYDLVVFALPDSLTLVSTSANLRLESFLFTSEAFSEVRDRLAPDGVFVMYNFYREDWLPQKIAGMLEGSFGSPPIVRIHGGTAATLAAGPLVAGLNGAPPPGDQVDTLDLASAPAAATDDWPFLYLKDRFIAPYYGLAIAIIIAFAVLLVARAAVRSGTSVRQFSPHFFVLGVAFLLLETKSIATFSLLFGTTWVVNSLVFFAVLASVLAAILVNQRVRFRNPVWLYAGLFGSLALAIALPPAQLLLDPPWLRYVVAAALAFAPIFFANLVFSYSFRDTKAADMAFASNLLGAVVGGAVEYVALVSGYSWLLFLVGGLYLLAWALASNVRLLADVGLTSSTEAGAPGPASASLSQVEVPQ